MRYWLIVLALVWGQAGAGEWFKTVEISAGLGDQYYRCPHDQCRGAPIGDGVLGKFSVSQSIYSERNISIDAEWIHISDTESQTDESPVEYFGIDITGRFDWH